MGRRLIAFVAVCIGAVFASATSAAGGGAVFEFGSDYFVPGDHVKGEALVDLAVSDEGVTGGLEDGPFFAYLMRSRNGGNRSERPDQGILLGQIAFGPVSHQQVEATIGFVVPEVKPGSYIIETCNADCSVQWIGDLVGGWFTVVATREEIPLRELEHRLTDRIRGLDGRVGLFRDRLVDVETEANSAASDAQLAVNAGRDLEAEITALQAQVARLRDESGSSLPELAGWFGAGLLAGVGVVLVIAHRRRRPEPSIPPDDAGSAVEEWPDDEPELVSSGRR